MDWSTLTAVAALLTSFTSLYVGFSQRRKVGAETEKTVTEALDQIIVRLRSEMTEMEKQIEKLHQRIDFQEAQIAEQQKRIAGLLDRVREVEKENHELRAGVNLLTMQVTALGHQPLYPPRRPGQDESP